MRLGRCMLSHFMPDGGKRAFLGWNEADMQREDEMGDRETRQCLRP